MDEPSWLIVAEVTSCDWKWPLPPFNTSWSLKIFYGVLSESHKKNPKTTQEVSYKVRFVFVECDRITGPARQLVSVAPPVCICVCLCLGSLTESFHGDDFILAQALAGLVVCEPPRVEEAALDTLPETQTQLKAQNLNTTAFIFINPNIQDSYYCF